MLIDAVQIDQVLYNLLDNAARHSPSGSPVGISARRDGDRIALTVSDRGRGFSDEILRHGPRPTAPDHPPQALASG